MTFTYDLAHASDRERVRYAIRDTDSTAAMFTDEEIAFRLTECGDWQHAAVDMLQAKILEVSNTPDFSTGNLHVSQASNLASLRASLVSLRNTYNIPAITATANFLYRPDNTGADSAPLYEPPFNDQDDDDD